MQRVQKKDCEEQGPQERAGVIAKSFRSKGSASVFLGDGGYDERIARRRTDASAKRVQQSCAEHTLSCRSRPHQRFGKRCQKVTRQGNGFSSLQFVRQCARETLRNVLRRLGNAVHQTNDTAGRAKSLRQKKVGSTG